MDMTEQAVQGTAYIGMVVGPEVTHYAPSINSDYRRRLLHGAGSLGALPYRCCCAVTKLLHLYLVMPKPMQAFNSACMHICASPR